LLYDSKAVFEDQLAAVEKSSSKKGFNGIDFSLLTDGLAAEREQGITIDVAYRYFSTPKRKFIIADTPGHEQYTRNMVTGASTAHLTIILIDARKGLLEQSRRHAFISTLLGIPYFIVAVNKMDLVDFSEARFNEIVQEFKNYIKDLNLDPEKVFFIPISALQGHNVVYKNPVTGLASLTSGEASSQVSMSCSWYKGPSIIEVLEGVEVQSLRQCNNFRFPVQYVIRADSDEHRDFRGFAGQIISGSIDVGDEVMSLPSGKTSRIKSINIYDKNLDFAVAPQSVTLTLEDEIDTSRGDMIVKLDNKPQMLKEFSAYVCWMSDQPLETQKKYLIKHTTSQVKALCQNINFKFNINKLSQEASSTLKLNEIGQIKLKTLKPIVADNYANNRYSGSFIIIDEVSNNTVGAGMISDL
jgi:sulfate adenylyltransferase subunit 1